MWTIAAIMIVFVLIIVFVNYMLRRGTWSKQSRQIKRQRKKMLAARFARSKNVPKQTKIADMRISKTGVDLGPRRYPKNERTPDPHEDMFNHTLPIMPLFMGVTQEPVNTNTERDEDMFNHTTPIVPIFVGTTPPEESTFGLEERFRKIDLKENLILNQPEGYDITPKEDFNGFEGGSFGGAGDGDTWEDNTTDNSVDDSCTDSTDWNNE